MSARRSLRNRVVNSVTGLVERAAISSRVSTPRGWTPAPGELGAILSQTEPSASATSPGRSSMQRRFFTERAGAYALEDATVLSVPSAHAHTGRDRFARRVSILNRWYRPVSVARTTAYVAPIIGNVLSGYLRSPTEVGSAALLGGHYSDCNNYFHYWVDVVGDVCFLERMGYRMADFEAYLMPFSGTRWQREILGMCGLETARIIPFSSFRSLRAGELVFGVRAKGGRLNPPWLVADIRAVSGWTGQPSTDRKIYLSRLDATRRPIENERTVMELVGSHGFEIHECSKLSVSEQQALFASASRIVAPHGAALTNLVWCNPGARLLEFYPENHGNPCFMDIAAMAGVGYQALGCPQKDSYKPIDAAYSVPLDKLQIILAADLDPNR